MRPDMGKLAFARRKVCFFVVGVGVGLRPGRRDVIHVRVIRLNGVRIPIRGKLIASWMEVRKEKWRFRMSVMENAATNLRLGASHFM